MVLDIDEVLPRPEERSRDDPGRLLVLGDESGRSDLEASSVMLGDASQIPTTWVEVINTGYVRVVPVPSKEITWPRSLTVMLSSMRGPKAGQRMQAAGPRP